ncbi:MAG TPA: SAM-dependent methyltransferase [Ktedonobacteraceae bacterium]|nr:SAM-dependent methyltransferase [Ktedonobacteraceae bacterium]
MNNKVVTTDYKQLIRKNIFGGRAEAVPTESLNDEDFIKATFSGQHRDKTVPWIKVIVRPVLVQGKKHLQFSYFDAKKDITKNYRDDEAAEMLDNLLAIEFRNIHVQTTYNMLDITITQKGKAIIHNAKMVKQPQATNLSHDRQKNVLLSADDAAPFLKAVGIMTEDGRIRADMQSKFRQINEFLKLVQQTGALETFNTSPLHVVDCGCGNAYLTFAFYYYLNSVLHIPTQLTGIDVNNELLTRHAEKSLRLGWSDLTFQTTSIIDFQPEVPPDIVLALHACDTATDEALAQGIKWQSKMIISAPCCQHHLQKQLDHQPAPNPFAPVERHSILKERLGDILTDTFRALILRIMGYQTDVVQFVSSEHTAKNLMIRAVKSLKVGDPRFVREYQELKNFWNVTPYLEELLGEDFTKLLQEVAVVDR